MKDEKIYYNLKEIIPIVNLKYRQLKTRVKIIQEKYKDNENLIFKKSNRWLIHKSIIKDFNRKRKPIDFKLFITINPEGDYPPSTLLSFVKHIQTTITRENPLERIKYVLEKDNRNYLHIHFLTTFDNQRKIRDIIKKHILSETQLNIHMRKLHSQENIKYKTKYMSKKTKPTLIRC